MEILDSDWTITHGFYTLMGGFAIDINDVQSKSGASFTNGITRLSLTPKGLLLLAKCGHLPHISKEDILDKSKVDELGKLLACAQVTWMIVQVCTRLGLHLPITTLEVTTVSHVVCALVLYALWWHKPRKVDEPTVLSGEWVRPLAAFMLMCSREPQGQTLPGYRLDSEDSEMAGLKLLLANPAAGNQPSGGAGHVRLVRKRDQVPLVSPSQSSSSDTDAAIERPSVYSCQLQQAESASITPNLKSSHEEPETCEITKRRWQLAQDAIEQYPAVRSLLHSPMDEESQKFATALEAYPEMPLKCREKMSAGQPTAPPRTWLECNTQHLVVPTASNWPHDGLLRTTSGLWIGASLWLVSIIFSAIHIAAWYAAFPTAIEAWLWRGAAVYIAFSGLLWAAIHVLAQFSARLWWAWYDVMSGGSSRWLTYPLVVVCGICGLLYVLSRAYLIVEALISLRLLPVAAYVTPEWTLGVPHVA